jgi:hypothetical protein
LDVWIVVARIAPEPINANAAASSFRARAAEFAAAQQRGSLLDDPLPPVPTPVPTPALPPIIQSSVQAFAAALAASELPIRPISPAELRLRSNTAWQAPDSPLRLADRRV